MAWILSITSFVMMWLMGNKNRWGPRLGVANQVLWIIWAISIEEWGLLPGVVGYTFIHIRNLIKWESE